VPTTPNPKASNQNARNNQVVVKHPNVAKDAASEIDSDEFDDCELV